MTDLRDPRNDLAALIGNTHITTWDDILGLADRILDAGWLPPRNSGRTRNKATCHPHRPVEARGLCKGCYAHARSVGTLDQHPLRRRLVPLSTFADVYERMRSEGATRNHIADRLGMTRGGVDQAYLRAVRAGALTPDRRPA